MQNLPKRQWGPSLPIKGASDIIIEWCIKAREKNVLRKKPAQLYFAYIMEDSPPLQYFNNISTAFRYSQKDMPYHDIARDSLLRCLSVALKAHFFLFPDDNVAHEPYFFIIPSLSEPNTTSFGLLYKIEKENKMIVICDKDLSLMFDKSKILFEFPTIVIEDSFKWYHIKNWSRIKKEANLDNTKLWLNKASIEKAKDAATEEELREYAIALDIPYEIKDAIKPLGIEWSKKVKVWYLPKGFDVDSVKEYIEVVKKEYALKPPIKKVEEKKKKD